MKLEEVRKITEKMAALHASTREEMTQELLRSLGIEPGSLYQELEMTSRYVDSHRDVSFSNAAVNLHSHTFYEILCCSNSCSAEYLVGSQRYRLQRGDIIIVPPGVSHRPLLPETMTEPYKRDVLWISNEFLRNLTWAFSDETVFRATDTRLIRTAGTKWESLAEMIHQGVREAEQKNVGWEIALAANTAQLIVQLRRAILDRSANTMKAEKKELMDRVMEYIEKHYSEKLTLHDLAHHFYVSESTISQTFRKRMGVSFYRCVTQRRLIAAKSLIEEGKPLEDVSQAVGFTDYSSFFRAFKQEFGISPREYRKRQDYSGTQST